MKRIFFLFAAFLSMTCQFSCRAQEKSHVVQLTTAAFLENVHNYKEMPDTWKYLGEKPCLIDFYANWCGPCRMLSPIIDELAAKYKDQMIFYKVNVDEEKELSAAFGIQSIPALLFVPLEGQPAMNAGVLPKDQLEHYIRTFILGLKE